jgi:glycosyltransferase involved in cell wall biosynthesis
MGHAFNPKTAMKILVLSTWFPYPPSLGSKIRAYYLIRGLAQRHDLALISFRDTQLEPSWVEHMQQVCQKVEIVERDPFAYTRVKTLLGWLSPQPSAVLAAYSPEMAGQAQRLVADWQPDRIVAITYVTAPYALAASRIPRIVDIDYPMAMMLRDDYLRASQPHRRLRKWLAYDKFRRYEKGLYPKFNLCLTVSEQDRKAAMRMAHLKTGQVGVVPNGVDLSLNQPATSEPVPGSIIFNGALTYNANFDAMDYFLREIFPLVRADAPEAHLKITGSIRGVPVDSLPADEQVTFTGFLQDIRPEVSGSCVCVVPLRMGGGTRLKILQAMALGTPVVSTSKGAEGLDLEAGKHYLVADTPREFAAQVVRLLHEPTLRHSLATQAAQLVKEKYDWAVIGRHFCDLVEDV